MMATNQMRQDVVYSQEAVKGNSDAELFKKLKEAWGYDTDQPLRVIGKLKKIEYRNENEEKTLFYLLEDLRSLNEDIGLTYPIEPNKLRLTHQDVFVNPRFVHDFDSKLFEGDFCKTEVQLSSKIERTKKENPFALMACSNLEVLAELPIGPEESIDVLNFDDKYFIEQRVLAFLKNKNRHEIDTDRQNHIDRAEKETSAINTALGELKIKNESMERIAEQLESKRDALESNLSASDKLLKQKDEEITSLTKNYINRKAKMDSNLERLNAFIEEKADRLLKLDLIDESDFNILLGKTQENNPPEEVVHFSEDLEGDYDKAISYIQAYLYRKDIFYKKDILRDFFALLRTNDLIILGGDSGSGKTNLVKSMAEAISGKSVIIPVKPNWTSSEDLLGYYNPLEKKYLSTTFLDALIEASKNPNVPYLICLDEMNLARVEYYFADFLSLLEDRTTLPKIYLYSDAEASHTLSEVKNFLRLITDITVEKGKDEIDDYLGLLKDEELNESLHKACGFYEGDSLLKYHSQLRRILSGFINSPSSIRMPGNVRIIGTVNVDETTHYLSPKILDRVHVMRFTNPLLSNWQLIENEIEEFEDVSAPLKIDIEDLGSRKAYPRFDRNNEFAKIIVEMTTDYLNPLGIEFGLRTIRQAMNYFTELGNFDVEKKHMLNNFVLHKVLPKLMFDGEKSIEDRDKKSILMSFREYLEKELGTLKDVDNIEYCVDELTSVIENAKANDWVVNYWSR